MQITVIIFLTLITLFELKIYKSNIKSLKSYVGYYKFIKSNKNIKFKKDEKISIINSKNKIVKTSCWDAKNLAAECIHTWPADAL